MANDECIDFNDFIRRGALATITIRNLDDSIKARLRVRAASHDRSMEEKVRVILRKALQDICRNRICRYCTASDRIGTPISMPDAQIAAICRVSNADFATRTTKDFEDTGLVLINPWEM